MKRAKVHPVSPDSSSLYGDIVELDSRLSALEAAVIEQEHRPFTVLKRFFIDRRKWPKNDPRRAASSRAVIWSVFFSPVSFAIGGTLIGAMSIAVLIWQSLLIRDQILREDRLSVEERRSNAIRLIYDEQYAKHPQIRAQALRELGVLSFEAEEEGRLGVDRAHFRSAGIGQDETLGFDPGERLQDEQIAQLFFRRLKGVYLESADLRRVSITNLNLDHATFVGTDLSHASLYFTSLRFARFSSRSKLQQTTLAHSDLRGAELSSVCGQGLDLSGSDLDGADFSGADLRLVKLQGVKNWRSAKFSGAVLIGARDAPREFEEFARQQGAIFALRADQPVDSQSSCSTLIEPQRNSAR